MVAGAEANEVFTKIKQFLVKIGKECVEVKNLCDTGKLFQRKDSQDQETLILQKVSNSQIENNSLENSKMEKHAFIYLSSLDISFDYNKTCEILFYYIQTVEYINNLIHNFPIFKGPKIDFNMPLMLGNLFESLFSKYKKLHEDIFQQKKIINKYKYMNNLNSFK